uniref:Uncharacterized protein n=1 Tax=Phasianus colchicus TaxID=9054 RepID=A0A669P3G7_PHACC
MATMEKLMKAFESLRSFQQQQVADPQWKLGSQPPAPTVWFNTDAN